MNENTINQQYDRITQMLQKEVAAPVDYNQNAILNMTNPEGYGAAIQGAQDRRQTAQMGILQVFEAQKARGDKQAQALDEKINLFTGGDPDGNALILEQLHSDPEDIDPSNSYQVMTKIAGIVKKSGYKSPEREYERQSRDLDLQAKRASIANAKSGGDKPSDVQSFEYMQSLDPAGQKAFMELKGKGSGLKPTEMKEIFEQDDVINAASDSMSIMDQMESLNAMDTYEGPMAGSRATGASLFGSDAANNTLELENLGKNLAASMLKTTFTGAISNAEREFLQDLQANASKTKEQRKRILDNGRSLVTARQGRAQEKQRRIQTGDYQTTPLAPSPANLGGNDDSDLMDFMTPEERKLFGK